MNQIMTAPRQRLMLVAATSVAVVASILVPMRADAAETRERAEQIVAFEQAMTEQQPDIAPDTTFTEHLKNDASQVAQTMSGAHLDSEGTEVLQYGGQYIVRIPMTGAGVEAISSRSTFYDGSGVARGTVEYAFRADGLGGGSLDVWQDGERRFSQSISARQAEKAMASAHGDESRASQSFWSKLNACLGKQNVSAWALAILAGVCAAACVVTVGVACAACIGATIGFPSGVVGACIAIANR